MAYKLIIKFPFQSVNGEQYMLAMHMTRSGYPANAIDAMDADSECFTHVETIKDKDVIFIFEGTLCGSVRAEDDSREDMFSPLCASKLKFSLACQQLPSWLMDMCNFATNVKVILYVQTSFVTTPLRVRWRGYLLCSTLNMTVVDNLMACPMVAVDEVGVSKYMPFRANCSGHPGRLTLYQIFKKWWTMNWNAHFLDAYTDLGLATNQGALYWHRNAAVDNTYGQELTDLLKTLVLNLERYYLDRDATWQNLLEDVCQYLGVHFCIGGYSSSYSFDNYILASYDGGTFTTYTYTLANDYSFPSASVRYSQLGNQVKLGADLQVTYDPDKWKGVQVNSTPARPEAHEYLAAANVKAIDPAEGHRECAECRIGKYEGSEANPSSYCEDLKYWRLIYLNIINALGQWTEEADYIEFEDCEVSTEGRFIGGSGYFDMTDAPLGRNRPNGEDTDSIEFIMEKRGMIPVSIGSMSYIQPSWPEKMTNYLMLLNNVWGRTYWDDDSAVSTDTATPFRVATIYPFGIATSIIAAAHAYLAIDFSALILNENIGTGDKIFQSEGLGASCNFWRILFGHNGSVFPMTETYHDYTGISSFTTGSLIDDGEHFHVLHFAPFLTVRLRVGNWFYYYDWNGLTSGWTYFADPDNAPTFMLPMIGNARANWSVNTGYGNTSVLNYYYTELHPCSNVVDPVFYVPINQVGTSEHPFEGRVALEIWWPTPYLNYYQKDPLSNRKYNNILSILIHDINIAFTDNTEISKRSTETAEAVFTDPGSSTKEMKKVSLELSTPKVDGFFDNCLVFDNGALWQNLSTIHEQGDATKFTPEYYLANAMASVYNRPKMVVELNRPFSADNYGDIANLDFRVNGLTEAAGTFVPVERKFNFTKGWVKWKLQQLVV